MNDLIFYFLPNSKIKVEVTSTTITTFYSKYLNQSLNEIDSNYNYKMIMIMDFRECIMGEYYISSLKMYLFLLLFFFFLNFY